MKIGWMLIAACACIAAPAWGQEEADEPGGMKTVATSSAAAVHQTIEESYLAKLDSGEWTEDDVVRDFSTRRAPDRGQILRGWLTAAGPRKDRAATFRRLSEVNDRLWRLEHPTAAAAAGRTQARDDDASEEVSSARYTGAFFAGVGGMLLYRLVSSLLIGLILEGDDVAAGTLLLIALGDAAASAGVATLAGVAVADTDRVEHGSSWPFGMGIIGYALSTGGIIAAAVAGERDIALGIGVSQLVIIPAFVTWGLPQSARYQGRAALEADSPLRLAREPSFGEEPRSPRSATTFALTFGF